MLILLQWQLRSAARWAQTKWICIEIITSLLKRLVQYYQVCYHQITFSSFVHCSRSIERFRHEENMSIFPDQPDDSSQLWYQLRFHQLDPVNHAQSPWNIKSNSTQPFNHIDNSPNPSCLRCTSSIAHCLRWHYQNQSLFSVFLTNRSWFISMSQLTSQIAVPYNNI